MKKSKVILAVFVLLTVFTSFSEAQSISGAGGTFPQPFYMAAFAKYSNTYKVKVSYGGIGSGGGIKALKDKVVDFGASDAFLSNTEMREMPGAVVHIPTCSGAVVVAFNLPGIKEIKLTPDLVADIFGGRIRNWDSPVLKKFNPGVRFPNKAIVVVHRSDASGTTNMFTDYLTKVSAFWRAKIGSGKTVNWPVGIAAKGNPGVAGTVRQTVGAVGYVGSEYSFVDHIPSALIENKSGKFIRASIASTSAAGKGKMPADTRIMITNSSARDAYPIAGFTWILLYKNQDYGHRSYAQAAATIRLIDWMMTPPAQRIAVSKSYAPLPTAVAAHARALLRTITYNGKKLLK